MEIVKKNNINSIEDIIIDYTNTVPSLIDFGAIAKKVFSKISSEEEIIKKLSEFIKGDTFVEKKFDIIKNIFFKLSPQYQEIFLRENLQSFKIAELSEFLSVIVPSKDLLLHIYKNKYEKGNSVKFIQILDYIMLYHEEYSNLFSEQELISMLKKINSEDLVEIIRCNNVIKSSFGVQTWYEKNCKIDKLSDYFIANPMIEYLPDTTIERVFKISNQKDFSNIPMPEGFSIISKFLSMPGEIQDKTIEYLTDDFGWINFIEMMEQNEFGFTEKLSMINCNKIFERFNNSRIDLLKLLSVIFVKQNTRLIHFFRFYKELREVFSLGEAFYIFNHDSNIKNLLEELKKSKIQLSEKDIINLKKTMLNGNKFNIETLDMATKYDEIEIEFNRFLNITGKINTLEENPVVDVEFIYFIWKNFDADFCIELSKYNTSATKEIIEAIKKGEIELIKFYIEFYKENNLFIDDDKKSNLAFMHFSSIKKLLIDIKNKQIPLNETDINNLRNIILSGNRYNINNVDELLNYDEIVKKRINRVLESDDINEIKENIAKDFCFDYLTLEKIFYGYDLSNFSKLIDVINSIPKELRELEPENYIITSQDIKLILLIKNIISCQDLEKLKSLLTKFSEQKLDYQSELDILLNKIKNIYGMSFNSILTNVDDLTSPRDNSIIPGVTIIDLNGEPFNFYAHRLYHYDYKFNGYSSMLEANPSLWTKLEGASTLSTSCISDKGLHFLHSGSPYGVVYLFNHIPNNSMLYMYGRDLYVEHGGHKINPSCTNNKFTDFESLVQATNYHHSCEYNELALFRNGIMPCAVACIGDTPNEATIRAAKHFNVPIIKLNQKLYDKQNEESRRKSREDFALSASFESLKGIFYDGAGDISEKIEFCLDALKSQFKEGSITYKEYVKLLAEMQKFVDKTYDKRDEKVDENYTRKIQLLRQSICIIKNLTEQEIIELETANMGESGIMYRMRHEDAEYLLKPSVEKTSLKTEPFRAEVQKAASVLQSIISPDTSVGVEVLSDGPLRISKQERINVDVSRNSELDTWFRSGGELDSSYTDQLLQEYVVDFLLCNFDCYSGNFIIDESNNVRGIDKEQSFRFIEDPQTLDPTFNYSPNGNSRIPIYSKLFEEYKAGRLDLNLDVISNCISSVEMISDEDYVGIFEKYAEALNPDKKQEMLQKILKRKYDCVEILKNYVLQLQSCKSGGVKL